MMEVRRPTDQGPAKAGFFSLRACVWGRLYTVIQYPCIEIGPMIFHAAAKFHKCRADTSMSPLSALVACCDEIKFVIGVVVDAVGFEDCFGHLCLVSVN